MCYVHLPQDLGHQSSNVVSCHVFMQIFSFFSGFFVTFCFTHLQFFFLFLLYFNFRFLHSFFAVVVDIGG